MVDVLALDGVVTISVALPYSVVNYKVVVSNINLVKYRNFSDADVLTYPLVKYYSFRGSVIRPYAHRLVHFYEKPFHHNLVYSSVLTPYHIFLNTHSISST